MLSAGQKRVLEDHIDNMKSYGWTPEAISREIHWLVVNKLSFRNPHQVSLNEVNEFLEAHGLPVLSKSQLSDRRFRP